MFKDLRKKLEIVFNVLKRQGKIIKTNVVETLKKLREVLHEANVNLKIVKTFTKNVKQKAIYKKEFNAVSLYQLMTKLVHDVLFPLSILLSLDTNLCNYKVTVCHSKAKNIADIRSKIYILTTLGKFQFVIANMIKERDVKFDEVAKNIATTRNLVALDKYIYRSVVKCSIRS